MILMSHLDGKFSWLCSLEIIRRRIKRQLCSGCSKNIKATELTLHIILSTNLKLLGKLCVHSFLPRTKTKTLLTYIPVL